MPKYSKGVFLNIFNFEPSVWEEGMRFIKSLDSVQHVELLLEYLPKGDEEFRALRKAIEGYRIIVHAPFINLTLMSAWDEINRVTTEIFHKTLEVCEKIDAEVATIHAGNYPFYLGEQGAFALTKQNFKRVVRPDVKTHVTIENLPTRKPPTLAYPTLASHLEKLKVAIPSLNFTLDVGHCIQNNNDDFYPFLAKFKNSILDIHLHDGVKNGPAHWALGKGELDLEKLLTSLHDLEYRNFVSLETISQKDTAASWELLCKTEEKIWK